MFEVVPDVDQKGITSQWICNLKDTPSDLVGKLDQWFEETGNDSPILQSLKMLLVILAPRKCEPYSMNIETAVPQGHHLDRDIYRHAPKEAI